MTEHQLPSGATLVVSMAPFSSGTKLLKTIARELRKVDVQLENLDLSQIASQDINTLKNALFQLIASDELEAVLFECMGRCTYNGSRIVRDTFESESARTDYLTVVWEVTKANLVPFFKGLNLSSMTRSPQTTDAPA